MKKILSLFLIGLLLLPCVIVRAESPEILLDPDFEEKNDDVWLRYVQSVIDFSDDDAKTGQTCLTVTDRTHQTDIVRQYVTDQLNFYGPGKYKMSASLKLADADEKFRQVQLVLGYYSDEKQWWTSSLKAVKGDKWTDFSTTQTISWEGDLAEAEFYFVTEGEQEYGEFADLLIDNCSLVKVDYEGKPYVPETPKPTPEPTEKPTEAPTAAPEETPSETPSEAPSETTAEPSNAPSENEKAGAVSTRRVIGFVCLGLGAVLLIVTILLLAGKRGQKNEEE